ncbi:protein kinase domain-containing protein [Pseudomonas sp. JZ134]|uniref:protein kinase domain-containing protein n=1 Tax=Pseudomonas sp. JZ134 TaxID=2806615 RepID=UPI003DA1BAFB
MGPSDRSRYLLEKFLFKGKIIKEFTGRGGLIYIVSQEGTCPDKVAYKTIQKFEDATPELISGFSREAENWIKFSGHYLIVTPYFVKNFQGIPLICMPYCNGDLRHLREEHELDFVAVLNLGLQIIKGLMVANSRGMRHHQDIKPENLLYLDLSEKYQGFPPSNVDLSVKFSVRIADFGVANAWDNGHPGGTNAYKAPEQYTIDSSGKFCPDVFAVGVVITELYQGYHPAKKAPGGNPKSWRWGMLERWARSNERNFAKPQSTEATELVQLLGNMMNADPALRPSFQHCYGVIASLLQRVSPQTLVQMELLFDYYDYSANHRKLEGELFRQLKISKIAEKKESVKEKMVLELRGVLDRGVTTHSSALETHHRATALYKLCGRNLTEHEKSTIVSASECVVVFFLDNCELFTSSDLFSSFSFREPSPYKLGSNIEARSEILNTNIDRLIYLKAYDAGLKLKVVTGGEEIRACLLMGEAIKYWINGNVRDACALLEQVQELACQELELDDLYRTWKYAEENDFAEKHKKLKAFFS